MILNNKFVYRYINEDFFTDVVNNTKKKVNVLRPDINVDGVYGLDYFITINEADLKHENKINDVTSSKYYIAFSVYMFNKIITQGQK